MKLKRKLYSLNPTKKLKRKLTEKATEIKDKDSKILNSLVEDAKENNVSNIIFNSDQPDRFATTKSGKNKIYMNKDTGNNYFLAHEVGHAHYQAGEGQKKLGGKIHKLNRKIRTSYNNLSEKLNKKKLENLSPKEQDNIVFKKSRKIRKSVGSSISGLSGISAGYKAEEEKEKGNKKKANIIKASSLAVPVLGHTPQIGSEIAASRKGMEYLKKAGASKQQLKGYRKSMGYALGTYAVNIGKNLVINEGGQIAGKGAYKLTHKKKKDKGRDI